MCCCYVVVVVWLLCSLFGRKLNGCIAGSYVLLSLPVIIESECCSV